MAEHITINEGHTLPSYSDCMMCKLCTAKAMVSASAARRPSHNSASNLVLCN